MARTMFPGKPDTYLLKNNIVAKTREMVSTSPEWDVVPGRAAMGEYEKIVRVEPYPNNPQDQLIKFTNADTDYRLEVPGGVVGFADAMYRPAVLSRGARDDAKKYLRSLKIFGDREGWVPVPNSDVNFAWNESDEWPGTYIHSPALFIRIN